MGTSSSKGSTQHKPQPNDRFPELPPYNGHPIKYHFNTVKAELDAQSHFSFMPPNMTLEATNEEHYFKQLAKFYCQGCKLLVFISCPGSISHYHLPSSGRAGNNIEFQGIFRTLLPGENEKWELQIVKSTLSNQMFQNWPGNLLLYPGSQKERIKSDSPLNGNSNVGNIAENFHIFQTLNTIAQEGGRLLSVELTGMSTEQIGQQKQFVERRVRMHNNFITASMPEMQVAVDVVFEAPRQPRSDKYVYQVVSCPLESSYHNAFPRGHFSSTINWQTVSSQYLETGWKLVTILEDYSVSSLINLSGIRLNNDQIKNCLLIFEKPVLKLDDSTPFYEGLMKELWVKSNTHSQSLGNGRPYEWEPMLEHYGKYGWQVVKILETPDVRIERTFPQVSLTRLIIFFQRLIENRPDSTTKNVMTFSDKL